MKHDNYDSNIEDAAGRVGRILGSLAHILVGHKSWGTMEDSLEFTGLGELLEMLGEELRAPYEGKVNVKIDPLKQKVIAIEEAQPKPALQ